LHFADDDNLLVARTLRAAPPGGGCSRHSRRKPRFLRAVRLIRRPYEHRRAAIREAGRRGASRGIRRQPLSAAFSLKARAVSATKWTALRIVTVNILQVAQLAFLCRILEPRDFGEVSLVLVVLTLSEVFTRTGIDEALLREQGDVHRYLDAAWSVQVARGMLLSLIVLAVAPATLLFQRGGNLCGLIALAAVIPALDGSRNFAAVLFCRELSLRRVVIAEMTVMTVSIGTSIALALLLRSSRAIVINMVVFAALRSASSYVIHPHRPRWTWEWKPLRAFVRFGIFFNLSTAATYLYQSLDRVIVGHMLGLHALGLYDRASMLGITVKQQFLNFMAAVVYPSFSRLLGRPERFRQITRKYLIVLGAAAIAVPLGLLPLADPLVRYLIGPKFLEIIPLFRILLLSTCLHGFTIGVQVLLNSLGRPRYCLYTNLLHVGVLVMTLPFAISRWDLAGACYAVVAADVISVMTTLDLIARGKLAPPAPLSPPTPEAREETVAHEAEAR
jgi:lipopolysaccharide exporter